VKLNENSEHDEVVMYAACLNPFSFQVVSGNILYAFVTIFCVKYLGKLGEIPSVSLFRIKISIKPFINKRVFCNLIQFQK